MDEGNTTRYNISAWHRKQSKFIKLTATTGTQHTTDRCIYTEQAVVVHETEWDGIRLSGIEMG